MSFFLLLIGLILFFLGRIDLGSVQAEGRRVKAAGVILVIPGVVTLLFTYFFLPLAFGRNVEALGVALGLVELLDLVGVVVAVALAYILIINPPNLPRLPGILGELQQDSPAPERPAPAERSEPSEPAADTAPAPAKKTVSIPTATSRPRIAINRDQFPSVMTLKEAARYLQTTEEEILKLIDDGKLVAARDNYNYQIAKSQLDELL